MKKTIKKLKHHHECECGKNEVYDFQLVISHSQLRKKKYKKRKYADTGETFFFLYTKTMCESCYERSLDNYYDQIDFEAANQKLPDIK